MSLGYLCVNITSETDPRKLLAYVKSLIESYRLKHLPETPGLQKPGKANKLFTCKLRPRSNELKISIQHRGAALEVVEAKQKCWLPVRARIEFKILLITFKVIKGLAPKYLSDLIAILPSSNYDLRHNSNGILLARSTLKTKKTMGGCAFEIATPILWNSLPL